MRPAQLTLLLAFGVAPLAQARPVTVDDLIRLRSISSVAISPDGERVAYVVSTASFDRDSYEPVLYVVSARGGEPVRMTYGTRIFNRPLPRPMLRWSPDGSLLSFLAFVDDSPQVFVMNANGGEPRPVTSAPEGVLTYEWAPDGHRLAYTGVDRRTPDEERRLKEKSFVIQVDRQQRPTRLWLQGIGGGEARALTPAGQFVDSLSWSPDGRAIAYAAASLTGFMAQYDTRLYEIAVASGTIRALVDRPGMNSSPKYSPDGTKIGFISTDARAEMMAARGLAVVSLAGAGPFAVRSLTAASGNWIGDFVWAADSQAIFFVSSEGTFATGEHMFEQPILRIAIESGRMQSLTPGRLVNYSPTISRDGRRLAYRSVEDKTMGDVVVMEVSERRVNKLTDVNPELRHLDLGSLEPVHWRSFDGMEVWGLLLLPPAAKALRPLPLVVYCHGGPIGGFTYGVFPQFAHTVGQVDPYPVQAMASAGMAALLPMPRGGSGYGEQNYRTIVSAWGEGDYKDIMAGVDFLVDQGIADPERLGVMGASYGGFMTSWIVTQTGRFKAASTGASVNDLADLYYLSDAGDVMAEYFKLPWEAPESYRAHSPVTHAARVTTPLLIQHGELDQRVPISLARKFYKALKTHGKTVEFDIYPRGGHIVYEPDMQREVMQRNLEWFTRWLKPGASPSDAGRR